MFLFIDKDDKEFEARDYLVGDSNVKLTGFGPIQRVNIFVGANNSGKSRFLRWLLKNPQEFATQKANIPEMIAATAGICNAIIPKLVEGRIFSCHLGFGTVTLNKAYFQEIVKSTSADEPIQARQKFVMECLRGLEPVALYLFEGVAPAQLVRVTNSQQGYTSELNQLYRSLLLLRDVPLIPVERSEAIYIPILRTAKTLYQQDRNTVGQKLTMDFFAGTTARHYNFQPNCRIVTGLSLYEEIRRAKNSQPQIRKGLIEFEKFLATTFFEGRDIEIVSREDVDDHSIHVSIAGQETALHHLGDGIQALIILMYPLFFAEKNSWIFIEEPETNLHPAFQRLFIRQLLEHRYLAAKQLRVFITTHSNHLLDVTLENHQEISIFTFRKKTERSFHIRHANNSDSSILSELGVRNSSVLIANCSIWLEGVTDRYYVQSFLKAYIEHNHETAVLEDLDYCFFEYSGSNVAHYLFVETPDKEESSEIKARFLNNRILLIADRDKGKKAKHARLIAQQSQVFTYEVLKSLEIENLLSEDQLKKFLPMISSKVKIPTTGTIKISNKDYLGRQLLEMDIIPRTLVADSGTLVSSYKVKLAEIARDNMKWGEMSKEARELAIKVFTFIKGIK